MAFIGFAGNFFKSSSDLVGRCTSTPLQFGQICSSFKAQSKQKVHSKLQLAASGVLGCRGFAQHSHHNLISSILCLQYANFNMRAITFLATSAPLLWLFCLNNKSNPYQNECCTKYHRRCNSLAQKNCSPNHSKNRHQICYCHCSCWSNFGNQLIK